MVMVAGVEEFPLRVIIVAVSRCARNLLRGSFYIDQTGIFSNDLMVVSGDANGFVGGDIWRVTSQTNSMLITNVGNVHLEGLITLPNNTNLYGPWAGMLITAFGRDALIFAVKTNGAFTSFDMDIEPEDFHIIPTNQDFYLSDRGNQQILKLPRTLLTNYIGDIIITQSGELDANHPATLFIVYWDSSTTNFVKRSISFDSGELEQGTFAPMNIPSTPISVSQ